MAKPTTDGDYYVVRRAAMLGSFDRVAPRIRARLVAHYDPAMADRVVASTRLRFESILPELPYIGGRRNVFTWVIIVNGWLVSLHRAMQSEGHGAEDSIRIAVEVTDGFFRAIPPFLLRWLGHAALSRPAVAYLKRQAARSQQRQHPQDFVYTATDSALGESVLEFSECAVNKFYEAQHAKELKPYCNFFDVTYSRLMNMGVDAHQTIGLGCDTCQLRYRHGRDTEVPERLRTLMPMDGTSRS